MTAVLEHSPAPFSLRGGGVCWGCQAAVCARGFVKLSGTIQTRTGDIVHAGEVSYQLCGQCIETCAEMVGVGTERVMAELDARSEAARELRAELEAETEAVLLAFRCPLRKGSQV